MYNLVGGGDGNVGKDVESSERSPGRVADKATFGRDGVCVMSTIVVRSTAKIGKFCS